MPTGSQPPIGTGKGFARVTAITHPKILLNREMSNLDQIRRRKNKWALVLLPAPTAPDFGSPWPQGPFFPLSGVGLAGGPEGSPVCLTAFGILPGVGFWR